MPRKARVIVPCCPHHIVQRGHNRKAVFLCDEDYEYCLNSLIELKQVFLVKIYAYCLMTNHVHRVEGDSKALSAFVTVAKTSRK